MKVGVMTDEQIFELASQHLHYDVDGDRADEWRGEHYELLKFALRIHEIGHSAGWCEGYKSGSTGVFGEPLG